MKIHDAARGKWKDILTRLGIAESFLTGRNGPCPMCQGRDRWRWTNFQDNGAWVCNSCGNGNGIDLVMNYHTVDFKGAAKMIEEVVGAAITDNSPKRDAKDLEQKMLKCWSAADPVSDNDPVSQYLRGRGIVLNKYPSSLRYIPHLPNPQGSSPAMLAKISDADGNHVNVHRTWLTRDGSKAPFDKVRMVMPGELPPGCAVRLYNAAPIMGIAEGIETALRAAIIFKMPVWAAISAQGMQKWKPPEGVDNLYIFPDNDESFVGQSAAYQAAASIKNSLGHIKLEIRMPDFKGTDWADPQYDFCT